ncbi:MAG: ABC transporter [Afipia sp.]|nr:ABC transporter [Afipia sp.]
MTSRDTQDHPSERQLLIRFWQSARGFWTGTSAGWAWLLTVLLIATVILQLLTQYSLNYWNRDFFNAVERKDADALFTQAMKFLPLAAGSLTLAIFSVWGRMTLQRKWRAWLSDGLYRSWLEDGRYIRLRFVPGDAQAPEFRIAEDGRVATDFPVDLVLGLFSSVLTGITFIGVLGTVGGDLSGVFFGRSFFVPFYLVFAVIIYSIAVASAMMFAGRKLTRVLEDNKKAEANLRSMGTHLRELGEANALSDNLADGLHSIRNAFQTVIFTWLEYCWQLMRVTLVTHTNSLLSPVFGLLLCMPKYVAGTMTLGEVVQAAAAFVVVQGACNWFADSFARLAEWAASANRVASLLLAFDRINETANEL